MRLKYAMMMRLRRRLLDVRMQMDAISGRDYIFSSALRFEMDTIKTALAS